MNNYS